MANSDAHKIEHNLRINRTNYALIDQKQNASNIISMPQSRRPRRRNSPTSEPLTNSQFEDLELGRPVETLQEQSHRLSTIMSSKTELFSFDQLSPDPPKVISVEKETSGLQYWAREASTAKEHGGDYVNRAETAFRTALGSFLTFAILVFPHQQIMGAVWIGMSLTVVVCHLFL